MQIRKVAYAEFFNANVITPDMIVDLASGLGMSDDAILKLLSQTLAKGSGAADCPDAKLRTVVLNKLSNKNDLVDDFTHGGSFEFEFKSLPDEAPAAEPEAKPRAARKPSGKLTGAYRVVKCDGLRCTAETDPEKFALWQFVWTCATFEDYFSKAPAKAVTRTGRIITASSEMLWAIKCGWIQPVAAA